MATTESSGVIDSITVDQLEDMLDMARTTCTNCYSMDAKACSGLKRFGCSTMLCNACFSEIFEQSRMDDFVCGSCPEQTSGRAGRHIADVDFSKDVRSPILLHNLKKKRKANSDLRNALSELQTQYNQHLHEKNMQLQSQQEQLQSQQEQITHLQAHMGNLQTQVDHLNMQLYAFVAAPTA
jgi:peptidoglycan hydrolase CwlO-like protein